MYVYDELDQQAVDQRVAQFRDQVRRRLAGALTEDEFRPLRLMNGLYLQLHAYMLRVAIPYGVLSSRQLRRLAYIARRWDRGYGHFTTRQNIQYHWPRLEDTPDILAALAEVQMHGIQTSGNSFRNTTTDQYAGAAADEIEDPRVWAEVIRQWSTFHPEFSFLPRKFKIAINAAPHDRAAVKVHDIGIDMARDAAGEAGFRIYVGGGLGRTPYVGPVIREFLPRRHLLSYLEAILRVYNQFGRRDNLFKARIKILVQETGVEKFRDMVEEEWAQIDHEAVDLAPAEEARIRAHFAPPPFQTLAEETPELDAQRAAEPGFDVWVKNNVKPHKASGYAIVNVSLKPIGGTPGDATAEQMEAVADLADAYSFAEIRVAHEQNLVLPHVRKQDLYEVWRALAAHDLATPNLGLVTDIIACPGLDYCGLANARSIPIAQRLSERFRDLDRQHDIGPITLNISGCINACGHHHVGHIGILGVDKKGEEFYQITLGGRADEHAAIGAIAGRGFSSEEIVDAVERVVAVYLERREDGERFIDTLERLGHQPFKDRLYATEAAHAAA